MVYKNDILYTVGSRNQGKLNQLQRSLPAGLVVDAAWLERHGFSRALRHKYVENGWLEQIAYGVFRRPPVELPASHGNESLRWQHVVISLQSLLRRPVSVGGRTALELQGLSHYLSASGQREVHLYNRATLPGWVSKLSLDAPLVLHNAEKLFASRAFPEQLGAGSLSDDDDLLRFAALTKQTWGSWDWPLIVSTPERAILELIDEVPRHETFHQADVLMEGLVNLRPGLLHDLLVECRNVKVKRLFLWFARRHQHAWFKRLDQRGIDLGSGKRMIVRGGKLDNEFNITVPEELHAVR